jgi:hypothetical protein
MLWTWPKSATCWAWEKECGDGKRSLSTSFSTSPIPALAVVITFITHHSNSIESEHVLSLFNNHLYLWVQQRVRQWKTSK